MRLLQKIRVKFQTSGLVLADQALVSGTNFSIGIILTRLLGIEAYGRFALLWMIILFGLSITQAIISKPLVAIEPKMSRNKAKIYTAAVHGLQLALSFLVVLICIICLTIISQFEPFMDIDLVTTLSLSVALGLIMLYDYYRKYFFLKEDLIKPLITDGILAFGQLTGIYVLYKTGNLSIANTLTVIALVYGIACIIGFIFNVLPTFRSSRLNWIIDKHYDFSKWLIGTVLLQWLSGNFFIIAAGGLIGAAAVGAVRIAQNVIGLTHVIFLAMENIIPVKAAQAFQKGGEKQLFVFLRKVSLQIGWAIILILITIAILAPHILEFLYGASFVPYAYILIGFCIIYLMVYIGYPLRFALRTLETTKPIFWAYVASAIFSLVSASFMIQYWGIHGLLCGLFITQILSQTVYIISLWKIKRQYENHSLGARES
jgi:O-antigen/teichoic acid export membrane protein